jgi:hypothetical protein
MCVFNGKFDKGELLNIIISFTFNTAGFVGSAMSLEIPIVINDDIMIPIRTKNPDNSPENNADIIKKAMIINGRI